MGFWTFLFGVPPVRPDTAEEKPADGGEPEAEDRADAAEGPSVDEPGETANAAAGEAEGPLTGEAIGDATGEVTENIFTDDVAEADETASGASVSEPRQNAPQEPGDNAADDPQDDDRLLETLMAVGAEADAAAVAAATEPVDLPSGTGPSPGPAPDPQPEPDTDPEPVSILELEPEPESVERKPNILDLSAGHKNDDVRATLAEMGDDGNTPRQVVHYALATDGAAAQEAVAEALSDQGFEVIDATEDGRIRMEHSREVASADFDAFTDLLEAELEAKGWNYDGWECAVVGAED